MSVKWLVDNLTPRRYPLNPSYDHNIHRTAESQKEKITYTIKTLNPVLFLNSPQKTHHWKQFFIQMTGILWYKSTSHTDRAEVFLGSSWGGGYCLEVSILYIFWWNYTFKDSLQSFWNACKRSNQLLNNQRISWLEGTLFIPLCFQWRSWSPQWIIWRDEHTGDSVVSCLDMEGPHIQFSLYSAPGIVLA